MAYFRFLRRKVAYRNPREIYISSRFANHVHARGVEGSPGCGGFCLGRYSLVGQRVAIGTSVVLAGYCPPGEFELGVTVVAALNGNRVIEKDGDRLVLRDSDGRIQIVLAPWEKREL